MSKHNYTFLVKVCQSGTTKENMRKPKQKTQVPRFYKANTR